MNSARIVSEIMRPALAFTLHLAFALLAMPVIAISFSGTALARWAARYIGSAGRSPDQFYSDHVLLLTSVFGMLFGYWVCKEITSRSAVWIWIPAVIAIAIRIGLWFSSGAPTGSVLFRESVIQHFFTGDCRLAAYCPDKLILMPWLFGPVAYSVGAALQRFVARRGHPHAVQP